MSENIIDIIQDIKHRADKEYDQAKTVRAIGRGNICSAGSKMERIIWITNTEPEYTHYGPRYRDGSFATITDSVCNALVERGLLMVSKNKTYAQRILRNYDGHHEVMYEGRRIVFDILNSANFTNPSTGNSRDLSNIQVGITGMKNFMFFRDIVTALKQVSELATKQKNAAEEEKAARQRLLELEEQRKRDEEERQRQMKAAKDAEEKRRIEEERRRVEEERQRQIAEEQERQRKAEEERKQLEDDLVALSDKYAHAASFIRKQASLRLNPRLSVEQEDIKFSIGVR